MNHVGGLIPFNAHSHENGAVECSSFPARYPPLLSFPAVIAADLLGLSFCPVDLCSSCALFQMGGSGITRSEQKNSIRFVNLFGNTLFPELVVWLNHKLQNPLKAEFKGLINVKEELGRTKSSLDIENNNNGVERDKEKRLQAWRDNPSWVDEPPKLEVKTQKGSFCHLNIQVNVGLPPETVYDIFTHPDNRRYFRNIKENISRKVLKDEGTRQVVEVEQAATWKFLWWSGTIPIHLMVDEDRKHLSSKYKQGKTMFMKVFEGCWRVEPLFVDEHLCEPLKPKTDEDYRSCSGGRGRIGSKVIMDQIFQPSALLTPPPLSWYIRGITVKTTESMIEDLMTVADKIRRGDDTGVGDVSEEGSESDGGKTVSVTACDIKERWRSRRREKRLINISPSSDSINDN